MVLQLLPWLLFLSLSLHVSWSGAALALSIVPINPSENQLVFAPEFSASGDRIFVKDIAQCLGHKEFCDEAMHLFIANAPPAGESTSLSMNGNVKPLVAAQLSHYAMQIVGAESIKISSQAVTIGKEELTQFCEQSISQLLKTKFPMLRIRNLRVLMVKHVVLRPTGYTLSLPVLNDFENEVARSDLRRVFDTIAGRRVLEIRVQRDDLQLPPLTTRAQIHLELDLQSLVTRNNLMRGHLIDHADLEYRWLPLLPSSLTALQNPKDAVGQVLSQNVRAGTYLVQRMLGKELLVQKGSLVKMQLQNGTMQLQGEAKALSNGALNDVVRVFYAATKKTLNGRVVGANLVEVAL